MRWLIALFLVVLLAFVGGWLSQADLLAVDVAKGDRRLTWVRTIDGWERSDSWMARLPSPPSLHPLVVAAGLCMGSLLALSGFSSRDGD